MLQDLEFVERTPVHEVVDLGDSDDEYSNDDNDDQVLIDFTDLFRFDFYE